MKYTRLRFSGAHLILIVFIRRYVLISSYSIDLGGVAVILDLHLAEIAFRAAADLLCNVTHVSGIIDIGCAGRGHVMVAVVHVHVHITNVNIAIICVFTVLLRDIALDSVDHS